MSEKGRGRQSRSLGDEPGRPLEPESIVLALRPTVFDCHILALDIAHLAPAPPEGDQTARDVVGFQRPAAQPANHGHGLLRVGAKGPCECRSDDQGHEVASSIKKQTGHETAVTGLSWTEKPRSAKCLTRGRAG